MKIFLHKKIKTWKFYNPKFPDLWQCTYVRKLRKHVVNTDISEDMDNNQVLVHPHRMQWPCSLATRPHPVCVYCRTETSSVCILVSTCILVDLLYTFKLKLLEHKNPQQVKDPGKRSGSAAVLAQIQYQPQHRLLSIFCSIHWMKPGNKIRSA